MITKLCDVLTDVSVREGSQQEMDLLSLSVEDKLSVVRQSARIGVKSHEIIAFAPGAWFNDAELIASAANQLPNDLTLRALYFNTRGLETLLRYSRFQSEGMFHTAVTKGYREKNYRQNTEQDIEAKLSQLLKLICEKNLSFDTLVLSTVWGEVGEMTTADQTVTLISKISDFSAQNGCTLKSVTLCDTQGQAAPTEISSTVSAVRDAFPSLLLRMHLHPAKDTAVECIHAAIDSGATEWEGSWGGMGGSPFADKAGGNLDIRYLIKAWTERGLEHGLNLDEVPGMLSLLKSKISRQIAYIA